MERRHLLMSERKQNPDNRTGIDINVANGRA